MYVFSFILFAGYLLSNSLRVSTPSKELQNHTTYFVTKYSTLQKINVKNMPRTFYVRWTFSHSDRTLLEQMRTLNVNVKGPPGPFYRA